MTSSFKVIDKHLSIVLLGQFNVLHHLPENLVKMGLLNSDDEKLTNIDLVSATDIQIQLPWGLLKVEVTGPETNRLSIALNDSSALILFRDFIFSIINYNDTSAPFVMGINYRFWIKHSTRAAWDNFGDCLTPKESWRAIFNKAEREVGMNEISVKINSIFEPAFKSELCPPELNILIKPVKHSKDGSLVEFCSDCSLNYHFPLGEENSIEHALITVDRYFDQICEDSEDTISKLVEKFS